MTKKIEKRLRIVARKYGFEPDDFVQQWHLNILEGKSKKQTLDQFAIDQLRKKIGRFDSPNQEVRQNLHSAFSLTDPENKNIDIAIDCRTTAFDMAQILDSLYFEERAVLCFVILGYNVSEISIMLGVSPGTIGKYLKKAQNKARDIYDN